MKIVCRAAATFGLVVMLSTTGYAYTSDQQRLCTGDAFRLCGSMIPNVELITVCMRKQKANLSAGCRSVFDQPVSAQTASTR